MTVAVGLGLLAAMAFCLAGPHISRYLPPATATIMLVLGCVCVAGATGGVLATMAFTAVAQIPLVAAIGEWSAPILRATDPVPIWVAVSCGLLLVPAGVLGVRALATRIRGLAAWYRMSWRVEHVERLIVVDEDRPEAFATPVGRGRIVVSTGMLRALQADERRALLAHEASHMSRGHAWWLMAADLSAAVNPLLAANARAVGHTVERWADEDAARAVGDREVVARSLARAALHAHDMRVRPAPALAAAGGRVGDRVRALLAEPPRFRLLPAVALLVLVAITVGSAVTVLDHTDAFLDHASVASWDPLGLD
jgi:Zn-dependent protease with chaperone function